jgi:DNA-binding CsgD family transcriptional regulator
MTVMQIPAYVVVGGDVREELVASQYFAAWTRSYGTATFILANDLRMIWANAAARTLIASGADIREVQGRFTFQDRDAVSPFRAFLAALTQAPKAWVYKRRQGSHLVVRAEMIEPEEGPPAYGVMVYDPDADGSYVWADFGSALGLTGSECRVVRRMVEGGDVEAVAEALCISVETVRTHVRNIYAKLGVRNREQLFALILPFRVS